MLKSELHASRMAWWDILIKHQIYSYYACISKRHKSIYPIKWVVKTRGPFGICKYKTSTLKCQIDGKAKPITFDFGYQECRHIPGIKGEVFLLDSDETLIRKMLEKVCELSDKGYSIILWDDEIIKPFEGSKILVDVDLEAPSYAHLDKQIEIPF